MSHRFKAILFDLDGTLIDSAADLRTTMNVLLAEEQRRPIALEEIKSCTGDGLKVMLDKAWRLTGNPLSDGEETRLMPRFLEIYAGVEAKPDCIYPGMLDFVLDEYEYGTRMAVVTNKHEAAAKRILKQVKLEPYFSVVVGGDTLPQRKPHPMPILHALHEMKTSAHDAVMIGDSPNDFMAARDAGIPTIIMRYGYTHAWQDGDQPTAFANHTQECRVALQLI